MGTVMTRKGFELRIGVGTPTAQRSQIWKVWSQNDEIYAAHRNMGHIEKFSFHKSGICRRAFVSERPQPTGMSDRVLGRWTRDKTPEAGQHQAVSLLEIVFPDGHLSAQAAIGPSSVNWLGTPGSGAARTVQLLLTNEDESTYRALTKSDGCAVLVFRTLPNGESAVIRTFVHPWTDGDLVGISQRAHEDDWVFSAAYVMGIERSLFLSMFTGPNGTRVVEMSGYKVPTGEGLHRYPHAATLTRGSDAIRGNDARSHI